jgi:dienelactone hydrolase
MSSVFRTLTLRLFPTRQRIRSITLRAVPTVIALLALVVLTACSTLPKANQTGPWNLHELSKAPAVTWGEATGLVQQLYYEGEPFQGKPTRIFAYLGRPANPESKPSPAMVLVHGGGGKAFKDWAEHWAERGYVALAMDLAGNGPDGRLPEGGPDQSDAVKFRNFTAAETRDMWSYHAVAAVVRGHSLLRSLPEVDKHRIGITGISWGGYLTCIVAGIDTRFKVAVPVYGCGFLGENSVWKDRSLAAMTPEARELWLREFDPSEYVGGVRFPILFVNGTTDFAYPLDSYQKTYRLVPEKWRHVSVAVNRPHGHIWTFPEVDAFVGSVLREEPPLVRMGALRVDGSRLSASVDRTAKFKELTLCYTTDSGAWQQRKWQTIPARIENGRLTAELPSARPLVAFLALQDDAGRHISSEHIEFSAP